MGMDSDLVHIYREQRRLKQEPPWPEEKRKLEEKQRLEFDRRFEAVLSEITSEHPESPSSQVDLSWEYLQKLTAIQWRSFGQALSTKAATSLSLITANLSSFTWQGFKRFGTALQTSQVTSLHLGRNNLSKLTLEQWSCFAKALAGSNVTLLNLRESDLSKVKIQDFITIVGTLLKENSLLLLFSLLDANHHFNGSLTEEALWDKVLFSLSQQTRQVFSGQLEEQLFQRFDQIIWLSGLLPDEAHLVKRSGEVITAQQALFDVSLCVDGQPHSIALYDQDKKSPHAHARQASAYEIQCLEHVLMREELLPESGHQTKQIGLQLSAETRAELKGKKLSIQPSSVLSLRQLYYRTEWKLQRMEHVLLQYSHRIERLEEKLQHMERLEKKVQDLEKELSDVRKILKASSVEESFPGREEHTRPAGVLRQPTPTFFRREPTEIVGDQTAEMRTWV